MPDSVIKKVEQFGKANATPNVFDFSDRNGVLFEWNDKVNDPALAAEIPGMLLNQDQPIPLIEDKIKPQGRANIAAANIKGARRGRVRCDQDR
jgi:hypothetical protein